MRDPDLDGIELLSEIAHATQDLAGEDDLVYMVIGPYGYHKAAATVVDNFRRRKALPSWFPADGTIEMGTCGRVTIAALRGTDGILRFGAARRHWRDEDDPETGARHAIGRLLAKP